MGLSLIGLFGLLFSAGFVQQVAADDVADYGTVIGIVCSFLVSATLRHKANMSLQVDDAPADWAVAGQSVVLHLSNIDPVHVRVGDIVCDPAKPIQCVDTFTLKALAFDFLMPMQVDVHRGRLHAAGRIEAITGLLDKVTGTVTKKKPKIVKPASVARIVVKLESSVPLEAGQRVVLRSSGETVAAGLLE